jgi:hypothetical protein
MVSTIRIAITLIGPMIPMFVMVSLVKPSFEINPEYINGILAANGVVFGFWAAIIGLSADSVRVYEEAIGVSFSLTLGLLIFSVFLLSGMALSLFPSVLVLFFSVLSFYFTCYFLGITLYYVVFK